MNFTLSLSNLFKSRYLEIPTKRFFFQNVSCFSFNFVLSFCCLFKLNKTEINFGHYRNFRVTTKLIFVDFITNTFSSVEWIIYLSYLFFLIRVKFIDILVKRPFLMFESLRIIDISVYPKWLLCRFFSRAHFFMY